MKVLAISGWKNSGKDTLAAYLVEKQGAERVSFADPLKDMVAEEYGIPRNKLDDPLLKEAPLRNLPVDPKDPFSRMLAEFLVKEFRTAKNKQAPKFGYDSQGKFMGEFNVFEYEPLYWTPRALAILKGSSNRAVRSNYWVQRAIQKAAKSLAVFPEKLIVISDLRYKSEMVQLKEAFGTELVTLRVERFDLSPSDDPSERDLDDAAFDYRINNRGSKEEAYQQLANFLATKTEKATESAASSENQTVAPTN